LGKAVKKIRPGYVVVANRTHEHYQALSELSDLDYRGIVLVEKPLFDEPVPAFQMTLVNCFVGYNLRFHPIIQRLIQVLKGERIVSAHAYVGQYLPRWRPDSDYRTTYSASRVQGGGVLRDLSHELDLMQWLLGSWLKLSALMGHYSHLEIDSEDVVSIMMVTERCPVVTVQLNYLDRITHRDIIINTDNHTYRADLVRGVLQVDNDKEELVVERDATYLSQHQAVLAGDYEQLCSFCEGLAVVEMIAATEKSFQNERWVVR
jgi:predicted dehydrogenase